MQTASGRAQPIRAEGGKVAARGGCKGAARRGKEGRLQRLEAGRRESCSDWRGESRKAWRKRCVLRKAKDEEKAWLWRTAA